MSIQNRIPELKNITGKAVTYIAANRFISNHISQHEYALIFTLARLVKFATDRYEEARISQITFLEDENTLNFTSLITFSSNVECFIDTLNRTSTILSKLLNDYPFYHKILPKDIVHMQTVIFTSTRDIRNKIQHTDNYLIGTKTKIIGSVIPFLNDANEFVLDDKKISVEQLLIWLTQLSKYVDIIAKYHIDIVNKRSKKFF